MPDNNNKSNRRFYLACLLISFFVVVALAPFASTRPDGLESVAEHLGFADRAKDFPFRVLLPDYETPYVSSQYLSTVIAGVVGIVIVFFITLGIGALLKKGKDRGTRIS